jgi:hypothetical protein
MAKRKSLQPWPETVWHSSGRVRESTSLQVIRQHLQNSVGFDTIERWREFTPEDESPWWWGFDSAWRTPDGDRVKARLLLAPDTTFVKRMKLSRQDLEAKNIDVELAWVLTAEADTPWDNNWRSPLGMFGDRRTYDWASGRMPLMTYTGFTEMDTDHMREGFEELAECPWYITVITHDTRPLHEASEGDGCVASFVPPSLQGRVLEFRVFGDQDAIINADGVLPDSKLRLKMGGALILPTVPRQDGWSFADYAIRRPLGGDLEQLLKEAAETVARYGALQPHYCENARWAVEDLRRSWVLPEIEEAPRRVLLEKQRSEEQVVELQGALQKLRGEAEQERREHRATRQEKDEAVRRLTELTKSPLVQGAHEARREAEMAWSAQEATDELAERLASEIGWLRRQLAERPGRSYDEKAPELPKGPESWEELLVLAPELLPKIRVLDDVLDSVSKIDRHPKTKLWLRRTWTALEAYQAYAEAKESQGPVVLPTMQAYLQWELADTIFPQSWHAGKEASMTRRDPKYAALRTFTVPEHGPVLMGEHVRIGDNRPPAPRMYLFDDTSGPTGLIWVGYIGPHLPNGVKVS